MTFGRGHFRYRCRLAVKVTRGMGSLLGSVSLPAALRDFNCQHTDNARLTQRLSSRCFSLLDAQIVAAIAPAQPTTPAVTLGLVPRAHSAAAPSPSEEVRSLLRPWLAGTKPGNDSILMIERTGHWVTGKECRDDSLAAIGRAACRERGGQYVWILVVAVS